MKTAHLVRPKEEIIILKEALHLGLLALRPLHFVLNLILRDICEETPPNITYLDPVLVVI